MQWDKDQGFSWDNSGCQSECSWFGFKIQVKDTAPFTRTELAKELDSHGIGNRMLFGGNLVRQPAFVELLKIDSHAYRIAADLSASDRVMSDTLFLGTYPGLTREMLDFEIKIIRDFCHRKL